MALVIPDFRYWGVQMRIGTGFFTIVAAAIIGLSGIQADCQRLQSASAAQTDEASSAPSILLGKSYSLHLHHLHTGESLDVVYRIGDHYLPGALAELNHFLRDHRTDDASHYDVREFDLLHSIMAKLGKPNGMIDIVCGYRTPWSNAFLRQGRASSGVAEHSQHIEGRAIDIRVPGVQTAKLRDTAESFQAGGVGYYPVSQFVHVDVGPVRTWSFGERASGRPHMRTAKLHRQAHGRRAVIHHFGN